MWKSIVVILFIATQGYALSTPGMTKKNTVSLKKVKPASIAPPGIHLQVFEDAVKSWASQHPFAYSFGLGPTTKAERWNGRHAMFGWIALLATGYAKGHNLIPNPEEILTVKEWGTLVYMYGGGVSNERAVVMIAHLHLLLVSLCASFAPLPFQDTLFKSEDEKHEPAAGLIPTLVPGLSMEAETLNGRLAMLGITVLSLVSMNYQMPILDVVNRGLGGLLY